MVSTGCSNDRATEVWPARWYISAGLNFMSNWMTERKSAVAAEVISTLSWMPRRLRLLSLALYASRQVPTTW